MINQDIIIIDDFYEDPQYIREYSISGALGFDLLGVHYPGIRSESPPAEMHEYLKFRFESILNTPIVYWPIYDPSNCLGPKQMNGHFHLCLENDNNTIHHDSTNMAGIIYLTPNAPEAAGTGFFRHKATGISEWNTQDPTTDMNKNPELQDLKGWECYREVENKFNRLVLFRATLYHDSMMPGFGNNYVNGRLTQVFFFNI